MSSISFAGIGTLRSKQNGLAQLSCTDNRTNTHAGTHLHGMIQIKCLIDSNAVQNLAYKSFYRPTWTTSLVLQNNFKFKTSYKQPISSKKVILIHLQKDDLRKNVIFEVVASRAVDLLLETSLIDKYIQKMFPAERRLVPWPSQPICIIVLAMKTQSPASVADYVDRQLFSPPGADGTERKVVAAKAATLAPLTYPTLLVTSNLLQIVVLGPTKQRAGKTAEQAACAVLAVAPNT